MNDHDDSTDTESTTPTEAPTVFPSASIADFKEAETPAWLRDLLTPADPPATVPSSEGSVGGLMRGEQMEAYLEARYRHAEGAVASPEERALAARRREWEAGLAAADVLIVSAKRHLAGFRGALGDPAERIRGPLAALRVACPAVLGDVREASMVALLQAVVMQSAEGAHCQVAEDGSITWGTLLYRTVDALVTLKDAGVPEPHTVFEEWMGDDKFAVIAEAMEVVLRGQKGATFNGNNNHEMSSLNFEVPIIRPTGRSLAQIRADLDTRPGLAGIKSVVAELAAVEQMKVLRRTAGLKVDDGARHMVFTGNPGTGKTTLARIVAEVLDATGSMPGAHVVEADRATLIGEFLGTSALKTRKVAEAAFGGVLFVDEAYALSGGGDTDSRSGDRFAHEALDTLVKIMEDERDNLVVILAGYPEGMQRLMKMNPGLVSRIGMTIDFPDYTDAELLEIFTLLAGQRDYRLAPDAEAPLASAAAHARAGEGFGNGRWVRNVLEAAIRAHALRLTSSLTDGGQEPGEDELQTLRLADVLAGLRGAA